MDLLAAYTLFYAYQKLVLKYTSEFYKIIDLSILNAFLTTFSMLFIAPPRILIIGTVTEVGPENSPAVNNIEIIFLYFSSMQKSDTKAEEKLLARMKPANISGPEHLHSLAGKCFTYRDAK